MDVIRIEVHDILKSELYGTESNLRPSCNLTYWNAALHGRKHLSPVLFNACFLAIVLSLTGGLPL